MVITHNPIVGTILIELTPEENVLVNKVTSLVGTAALSETIDEWLAQRVGIYTRQDLSTLKARVAEATDSEIQEIKRILGAE